MACSIPHYQEYIQRINASRMAGMSDTSREAEGDTVTKMQKGHRKKKVVTDNKIIED